MTGTDIAYRQGTINRAITLLDTAEDVDLTAWLDNTNLHDHIKDDPDKLRNVLVAADPNNWAGFLGAWKAAQQLVHAADRDRFNTDLETHGA